VSARTDNRNGSQHRAYFARFNEYARAEDGIGRSRIGSCRHRHATIADARSCDRTDLTDLVEFSANAAFLRYVALNEIDDDRD
jgi:hypothetical protein